MSEDPKGERKPQGEGVIEISGGGNVQDGLENRIAQRCRPEARQDQEAAREIRPPGRADSLTGPVPGQLWAEARLQV